MRRYVMFILGVFVAVGITGCTVHPKGEREERNTALVAGHPYSHAADEAAIASLPNNPTPDEIVQYALLTNGDLEQKYWDWRSAIEQIPQSGTQPTNLVLFAGVPITNGSTSFNRTTVTAANDPMSDILWPAKLTRAAQLALDEAKAAGVRFQKAKYEVRSQVLGAFYDYALTAEQIRLEEANNQLLTATAATAELANRSGATGQRDVLNARNEIDLSTNEIKQLQSQLTRERAVLNALMNRPVTADIAVPTTLPAARQVRSTDDEIVLLAKRQNPELEALAYQILGKKEGIELARLQYYPDFSASIATDLAGSAQNLAGMVTVPILRHEAIEAAINQAKANLRAAQAMQRQAGSDLNAKVVADLSAFRDADRQMEFFQTVVVPRTQQIVALVQIAYESGRAPLSEVVESERALVAIEKLCARLRIEREKLIANLEAIAATRFATD